MAKTSFFEFYITKHALQYQNYREVSIKCDATSFKYLVIIDSMPSHSIVCSRRVFVVPTRQSSIRVLTFE